MCAKDDVRSGWIRRRRVLCVAIAAFGLVPWSVGADEAPSVLEDSFFAMLGTFVLSTDTEVRLDGEAGEVGTPVDWEETFGDDDVNRFRLDGYWRFADRHKVRFLAFTSTRDSSRTLDTELEWGDVTYPVAANASAEFKFSIIELAYEYAFLRRDSYEVAANFGLHYTELKTAISADAAIEGEEVVSGEFSDSGSFGAPLPVIGIRGTWRLPYDFWLDASAQVFYASIDEYDGSLQDFRVMLGWQPKTWLGLGIGYNQFNVDVDVTKPKFSGSVDWTYKGPMVFYSASF